MIVGREAQIAACIVKSDIILGNDARITVAGEAVRPVAEGDGVTDDVMDEDALPAELETVLITCTYGSVRQVAVVEGGTVLNKHGADCTSPRFGVQVPAVVNIVVRQASAEHIADAGG
ncbi:hypothetical protein D3C73_1346630 [compost metagenome]